MKSYSANEELLHRIVRYLVINASFTKSLGLFHGKMGLVIFFYHYARYSQSVIYEEFAGELLDEIHEDIHIDMPIDFENGLSGIAWGIEYLRQSGFVEGETVEVLTDINLQIMERDPQKIKDMSFRCGLAGIGYYIACHVGSCDENSTVFDLEYLGKVSMAMNNAMFEDKYRLPDSILSFYKNDIRRDVKPISFSFPNFLFDDVLDIDENKKWNELSMGLEKGIAGLGFKLINQ